MRVELHSVGKSSFSSVIHASGVGLLSTIAIFLAVHLCELGVIVNLVGWTLLTQFAVVSFLIGAPRNQTPMLPSQFATRQNSHHPTLLHGFLN